MKTTSSFSRWTSIGLLATYLVTLSSPAFAVLNQATDGLSVDATKVKAASQSCDGFCSSIVNSDGSFKGLNGDSWQTPMDDQWCADHGSPTEASVGANPNPPPPAPANTCNVPIFAGESCTDVNQKLLLCKWKNSQAASQCQAYYAAQSADPLQYTTLALDLAAAAICGGVCAMDAATTPVIGEVTAGQACTVATTAAGAAQVAAVIKEKDSALSKTLQGLLLAAGAVGVLKMWNLGGMGFSMNSSPLHPEKYDALVFNAPNASPAGKIWKSFPVSIPLIGLGLASLAATQALADGFVPGQTLSGVSDYGNTQALERAPGSPTSMNPGFDTAQPVDPSNQVFKNSVGGTVSGQPIDQVPGTSTSAAQEVAPAAQAAPANSVPGVQSKWADPFGNQGQGNQITTQAPSVPSAPSSNMQTSTGSGTPSNAGSTQSGTNGAPSDAKSNGDWSTQRKMACGAAALFAVLAGLRYFDINKANDTKSNACKAVTSLASSAASVNPAGQNDVNYNNTIPGNGISNPNSALVGSTSGGMLGSSLAQRSTAGLQCIQMQGVANCPVGGLTGVGATDGGLLNQSGLDRIAAPMAAKMNIPALADQMKSGAASAGGLMGSAAGGGAGDMGRALAQVAQLSADHGELISGSAGMGAGATMYAGGGRGGGGRSPAGSGFDMSGFNALMGAGPDQGMHMGGAGFNNFMQPQADIWHSHTSDNIFQIVSHKISGVANRVR